MFFLGWYTALLTMFLLVCSYPLIACISPPFAPFPPFVTICSFSLSLPFTIFLKIWPLFTQLTPHHTLAPCPPFRHHLFSLSLCLTTFFVDEASCPYYLPLHILTSPCLQFSFPVSLSVSLVLPFLFSLLFLLPPFPSSPSYWPQSIFSLLPIHSSIFHSSTFHSFIILGA